MCTKAEACPACSIALCSTQIGHCTKPMTTVEVLMKDNRFRPFLQRKVTVPAFWKKKQKVNEGVNQFEV